MLKKYKQNYLLIGAVILYSTFFIIYFSFFSIEEISNKPNRLSNVTDFKAFILLALIIAPILEEFIFRSYFTKNKILKLITIISLPVFVLLIGKQYLMFVVIPYTIILIIDLFKIYKIHKYIIFIGSALLFSMAHYKLSAFESGITALPILAQFSIGLLLIWVVLNFNLKTAIFVHFTYNLTIILPIFIYIQFPNIESKSLVLDEYRISWQKTPVFGGQTLLSRPNSYQVYAVNISPSELYKMYNSSDKIKLINTELFSKYKISIEKINDSDKILDSVIVKSLLLKSNLILNRNED
jgi:membrane protease YdiL (CAAX protease family)|tara:strand:- start:86 stop:973 length:888 start_codon:yes stop_codon:yes gene_type:complete